MRSIEKRILALEEHLEENMPVFIIKGWGLGGKDPRIDKSKPIPDVFNGVRFVIIDTNTSKEVK